MYHRVARIHARCAREGTAATVAAAAGGEKGEGKKRKGERFLRYGVRVNYRAAREREREREREEGGRGEREGEGDRFI
jgi:hypothetical protein